MPRSEEISHYSLLITDLQIAASAALIRGDLPALAEIRSQLVEAHTDIFTLLSHDALKGADLDRSLLDVAVERGAATTSEEAKV